MADNELTVVRADGQTKTLRDRDISGNHAQKVDVAPWVPTTVTGAQYNVGPVVGTVVQLTVPSGATHVLLTVDGGDVRFAEESPYNPTSSNGLILKDGTIAELAIPGSTLGFIRADSTATASNIRINATFRRYV